MNYEQAMRVTHERLERERQNIEDLERARDCWRRARDEGNIQFDGSQLGYTGSTLSNNAITSWPYMPTTTDRITFNPQPLTNPPSQQFYYYQERPLREKSEAPVTDARVKELEERVKELEETIEVLRQDIKELCYVE